MNTRTKNNGFKTSIYLMLALALGLVGLIFYIVGSNQKLFDAKYSIYMFKTDAESLIPGAFITLSGLKVGVVGEMKLTTREQHPGILIELKIDKDYRDYITSSSVAQIKTMGVLGDKYVDISLGQSGEPPLPPGAFIKSRASVNMDNVMSEAAASISELKQVLSNINKLTRQTLSGQGAIGRLVNDSLLAGDLKTTLRNTRQITQRLKDGKGNAGKFLRDSSLYGALLHTTEQMEIITRRMAKGEGSIGKALADSGLYVQVKSLIGQTDSLMKKLNGNGTVGKLIKDKEYYDELLRLTRELRALTEDIKQHPEKYGSFRLF